MAVSLFGLKEVVVGKKKSKASAKKKTATGQKQSAGKPATGATAATKAGALRAAKITEEEAEKLKKGEVTPEAEEKLKQMPIPEQREKYGVAVWPGGLVETELLSFRSTLALEKVEDGKVTVGGWVTIINPNKVPKKVKFYVGESYFKPTGPRSGTWVGAEAPAEVCVCGKCGREVEIEVPPESRKHCTVRIMAGVIPVETPSYELELKAYYKHPKRIEGRWVMGGTEWTVSAVDLTEIVRSLAAKKESGKPGGASGKGQGGSGGGGGAAGKHGGGVSGGSSGGTVAEESYRLRERERRFWQRRPLARPM